MNPKFTVILPTYNRAHLLPKAVESILDQTVKDWELIVIDDGSTDDTKEVVFAYQDSRIKYGRQENHGRSVARNAGIHHAIGDWICFLDSDDWYQPNHLRVFKDAIENHPDYFIFKTGVVFINEDGVEIQRSEFHNSDEGQIPFILQNYSSVLDHCISSELAKKATFPNIAIWEDKAYMSILLRHYKWKQLQHHTVVALEHQGRSINYMYKDIQGINKTLSIMEECLQDVNLRDRYLGSVQQNLLLSMMINAREMGIEHSELKNILKGVKKSVMPMTWVKYWKLILLG